MGAQHRRHASPYLSDAEEMEAFHESGDPAADVTAAAGSDVKILVHATKGLVLAEL